jgi:uncharacterized cupin superfamily protein
MSASIPSPTAPVLIRNAATVPVLAIGPVALPLGVPVPELSEFEPVDHPSGFSAGIWECTPGRYRRTVTRAEFCHFIAGSCRFEPDIGEPLDIVAGDVVCFAANTHGLWTIHELTRKSYIVFTP